MCTPNSAVTDVNNALRRWLDDPEKNAEQSAAVVLERIQSTREVVSSIMVNDLAQVLFRRCVERQWGTERLKVENPVFRLVVDWFNQSPRNAQVKLIGPCRKLCIDALEEMKGNLGPNEDLVICCLETLGELMEFDDFPDFAVTFLKIQRFSVDGVGRHNRRNENDLATSARSLFASLKIFLRHSTQALFDVNPSFSSFFEMYPRWVDDPLLSWQVRKFTCENGIIFLNRTSIFQNYRAELCRGYSQLNDSESKGYMENLVQLWSREGIAPFRTLLLEALSEDPMDGLLPKLVITSAKDNACRVEAIQAAFEAEQDGAIESLPRPILLAIQEAFEDDEFLAQAEKVDFPARIAAQLLSGGNQATSGLICWIIGEIGSKRNWTSTFHSLVAFAAIVDLSEYERTAVIHAQCKYAVRNPALYRQEVVYSLRNMPCGENVIRDRALHSLNAPFALGKYVFVGPDEC